MIAFKEKLLGFAATGKPTGNKHRLPFRREVVTLRIWTPPDFAPHSVCAKRTPVVFLNDGQNLFDAKLCMSGQSWEAVQVSYAEHVVPQVHNMKERATLVHHVHQIYSHPPHPGRRRRASSSTLASVPRLSSWASTT